MTRTVRWLPSIGLCFLAAVATFAVGSGNIVADGASELHIAPRRFLSQIAFAWKPELFLGFHSGAMHLYESPASWMYAVFADLHVSEIVAQRCVDYLMFLAIAFGMYWALAQIAPNLTLLARFCGAAAFLFNPYVAFNSNGSTPFLLLFAEIPWLTGITAAVAHRRFSPWVGAAAAAFVVLVGSGNNMPLIFLAAIIAAIYALVAVTVSTRRKTMMRVLVPFTCLALAFGVLLNLYWLAPAVDWYRTAWIGGVLDETPALHNGDSSYANVLRGLGQWAIFAGDDGGPWYRWATSYRSGPFASLLWAVTALAFWAPVFKRARTTATAFFLMVAAISVPLAVGYYHGVLGDAVTTPVYDFLYRNVPGFQMFRAAYKWVSPVMFSVAGLLAISVDACQMWLLERIRRYRHWTPAAALVPGLAVVTIVIATYTPVVINKANDPSLPLPLWVRHENRILPLDSNHRVALFPTQYLDRFDWGSPMYEMEDALIDRPLIHGYLGSAASEGTNQWIMRAFHSAREDDPNSKNIFAMLSANSVLQRDDFDNALTPDFAFPGIGVLNNTTIAHDIVTRVLKGRPIARDGALQAYALRNALPIAYGVQHPMLSTQPSVSSSQDLDNMARGRATLSSDSIGLRGVKAALRAGALFSSDPVDIDQLATTIMSDDATTVPVQTTDNRFTVSRRATYRVFIADTQFLPSPERLFSSPVIDGARTAIPKVAGAGWQDCGPVALSAGRHTLHLDGTSWARAALVKFVEEGSWMRLRAQLEALSSRPTAAQRVERDVNGTSTVISIRKRGLYSVRATKAVEGTVSPNIEPLSLVATRPFAAEGESFGDRWAHASSLPYVPLSGVLISRATMSPQLWYESADTFRWNRGYKAQWMFLSPEAHFRVFSPWAGNRYATLGVHIANLGLQSPLAARKLTAISNGVPGSSIALLPGIPAATTANAADFRFATAPVKVALRILLQAGINDVAIVTKDSNSVPASELSIPLANERIVAAVAPDLEVRSDIVTPAPGHPARPGRSAANNELLEAFSIRLPVSAVEGDPHITGRLSIAHQSGAGAWLAVDFCSIKSNARNGFRLYPLPVNGQPFDVDLPQALPNSPTDAGRAIRHSWIVVTRKHNTGRSKAERSILSSATLGFYRAVSSPRILKSLSLAHAVVYNRGGGGIEVMQRPAAISAAFSRGTPALPSTVDLTIADRMPTRNARLVIPMALSWLELAPSLEVNEGQSWHLVGERTRLYPRESRTVGASTSSTFLLPRNLNVYADDIGAGRVSLEVDGTAVPLFPAENAERKVVVDTDLYYENQRLHAITLSKRQGRPERVALIVMPGDWISNENDRVSLSIPATALPPLVPNHSSIRLRLMYAPDFELGIHRRLIVFAPRWVSTVDSEKNTNTIVAIDGRRLSASKTILPAGRHEITSFEPAATLAHVTVARAGDLQPAFIPLRVTRRSPVALTMETAHISTPFVLVFGESFHPEWQAILRGKPLQHVLVNGYANGWLIPRGSQKQTVSIAFTAQRLYDETLVISTVTFFVLASSVVLIIMSRNLPYQWARSRRGARLTRRTV